MSIKKTADLLQNLLISVPTMVLLTLRRIHEIFASGIWNTAQGMQNPTNSWNLDPKVWNPESKSVLHSFKWSETK